MTATLLRDTLAARLLQRDDESRAWIIALGVHAAPMAHAALFACADAGLEIAGGLIVAPEYIDVNTSIESVIGDHPIPGPRSLHAATRLGALVQAVLPSDHVILLVSGGAAQLVAAPGDGDGRWLRWSGGRLATALAPATVYRVLLATNDGDPANAEAGRDLLGTHDPALANADPPIVIDSPPWQSPHSPSA